MTDRMLGALRLQTATYEEIEADQKGTGEAAFIVVATSLVSGAVNGVLTGASSGLFGALGSFLGWAFYAWIAYIVGVKLFPGKDTKSSWGEIARTLGYANTPRFLIIFELVPGFAAITRTVVGLWVLGATIVALRSALDISTGRAIWIAIASAIGQVIVIAVALTIAANLIPS
ncbi:MAG TPA: YIP1 family protein [Candidatus Limnocylindria bacterium]